MDKTEEYIKQCDCPEMQSDHVYTEGDVFYEKLVKPQPGGYQEGIYLEYDDFTWGSHAGDETYPREKLIWLPRQDQLQEMVESECPLALFLKFYRWMDLTDIAGFDDSMEQLWLAFVMKEKYNKVWDGNEWQNS